MAASGDTLPEGKPETTPDRPGELVWIREALNSLNTRLDKIEERLRKVENRMYWIGGIITALLLAVGAIQILMRVADVSITLK